MPDRRPSVRDVAELAGVSVATVSRVISGKKHVSPGARIAVTSAIKELKFRPSQIARSMVQKSTSSIGLVVSDVRNPYYPELIRGIDDEAYRRGFALITGNSDDDPIRETKLLTAMQERSVDGLILASVRLDARVLQDFVDTRIPILLTNRISHTEEVDIVSVNDIDGAELVTRHLLDLGHRRIAFICGPAWASNTLDRQAGFERAMAAAGVEVDPTLIIKRQGFTSAGGYDAARTLIEGSRPTAIVCANDVMALGVLGAISDSGLNVPNDIAVVSFDDTPLARSRFVSLTSVSFDTYKLGTLAASRLLDIIESHSTLPREQTLLPASLHVRRSSGARLSPPIQRET